MGVGDERSRDGFAVGLAPRDGRDDRETEGGRAGDEAADLLLEAVEERRQLGDPGQHVVEAVGVGEERSRDGFAVGLAPRDGRDDRETEGGRAGDAAVGGALFPVLVLRPLLLRRVVVLLLVLRAALAAAAGRGGGSARGRGAVGLHRSRRSGVRCRLRGLGCRLIGAHRTRLDGAVHGGASTDGRGET